MASWASAAAIASFPTAHAIPGGIQRLKDKWGNRSNAFIEVEYHDALAWAVGEGGHGIRAILSHASDTARLRRWLRRPNAAGADASV